MKNIRVLTEQEQKEVLEKIGAFEEEAVSEEDCEESEETEWQELLKLSRKTEKN